MVSDLSKLMDAVREKCPLVHHITNYVTVNDCANICICSGGSPVMTDADNDVVEMSRIANAVVLNMGTLNPRTVEAMMLAGGIAKKNGVPVIFDAVGAGATSYRNIVADSIINRCKPDIIKGNAGEISFLAGVVGGVKGVDSISKSDDIGELVRGLAQKYECLVVATGKKDYVSDGKTLYVLSNGSDYQGCVSGTGCMLSSVLGAYVGANGVSLCSVIAGITAFNVAAEKAEVDCKGPGSFKVALLDCLFNLKSDEMAAKAKVQKV
jgi:hydroxyethylthiazole kinase